ncbi:condensation domain-containing protein, partial [Methylobacterium sp. Leaf118]|uniref:condensation domain-containing protein n=1 Tax=Methylobacterium sp. Leaf118 TaxID=2876562 RepID=UPI0022B771B6
QLVGYVVPEAGAEVDGAALRRALAERLPDYMVPAAILRLERLPLTPNGKLDRRALPAPDFTSASRRAASTPQEEVLCHLFEAVLGLPQVGPDDSFFDLGGHSLLAMRMIARIRQAFDTELSIRTLFEAPTPAGLAERLGPGGARRRPSLQPQARPAVLPLSFAQRRLWLLAQIDGPGATYNMPFAVRLEGPLDVPALAQALRDVVARHESLRTRFAPDPAGGPVQQVLPADDPRALPALTHRASTPDTLAEDLAKASRHRFDLAGEGLIRTHLLALAPDRHVLLVLIHHAIADGWSLAPLARDLGTAYAACRLGQAPAWADLPVHYADYTLWQQDWLGQDSDPDSEGARQLGYWREALAGLPEQLDLPVDRPRPAVSSGRGGHVPVRIEPELHRQLRGLAQGRDASLFMVLQAGLAALLSRLGAGPDIPIGSPTAGRTDPALDDLIGFFVNTLVLRVDTGGNPSFAGLLGRVRERALAAYEHQDLPFERLVEVLRPARSLARHPLFQVMLVLQNTAAVALALPGLKASPVSVDTATTKFDLTFSVEERFGPEGAPAGIAIDVEYACDLFEAATVADLGARLVRLLQAGVAAPDTPIGRLDILSAAERHRLLEAWNATVRPLPEASLPALFERQAARTPEATALVHAGERLSYAALNGRANRLARHLTALGIGPEARVALALPRSSEMVVGLLAILKAGAAYVPLDPNYPVERLRFMLADAAPRAVLTTAALRAELAPPAQVAVILPEDPALQAQLA